MLDLVTDGEREEARELLASHGLRLDGDVEVVLGIRAGGRLVATGSLAGAVLKCLAVAPSHEGEGLTARVVTALADRLAERGIHHWFVFTRPGTAERLAGLGCTEVARVDPAVVLLEGGHGSVRDWAADLARSLIEGPTAAVVVNANPLTKGHLHLLRRALDEVGALHVLVVSTDRSLVPTAARLAIVREATADWPRTAVHEAGAYLVSAATFPSYFTRDEDVAPLQARLDVAVFLRHVVPALGVRVRYVGEEPYCPVTRLYNEAMAELLPPAGVRFVVVPRLALGGEAVSASRVRAILHDGGAVDDVAELVPPATLRFLRSDEGGRVVERIRLSSSRH